MKSEWKPVKLKDVIEFNPRESIKKSSEAKKIPMEALSPFQRKIEFSKIEKFTGGVKFRNGDILMARITPSLENGKTAFVDILDGNEVAFGSTEFFVLRARKEEILPKYLYYLSISNDLRNRAIKSMTGTSGRQRAQKESILDYEIFLPRLDIQTKIVSILDSLDSKIELNNQMIATLEELAATLFKRWFVDFEFPDENGNPYKSSGGKMVDSELGEIPEGWEVKQLNEICEVKDGTHDSPKQQISGYPLVTSKHLGNNKIDFETAKLIGPEDYKKVNQRSKVDTDDILISMIGTVGRLYFVSDEKINFAIKNIGLIKTSTLKEDAYFIFLQLSSDRLKKYVQTNQAGSTQQYISLTNLRKMPIIQPKWNELSGFNEITGNISLEIRKVVDENATLIEIRNKLLPRILSGELEI
ncbi:TPA: restriction endonuclease subunit S [Enterococcus faecium]